MRLIDAEVLENEIVKTMRYVPKDAVLDVACMVNRAPTIEAKPVVRAHWEKVNPEKGVEARAKCSHCKVWAGYWDETMEEFDYCPYCGAQMDEKEDD